MKQPIIVGMTDNLVKGMSWLAKTFAETLRDPAQEKEDIYHDLWVVYLEKNQTINRKPLKRGYENRDGLWFMIFKNYLIDRARRSKLEPNSLKIALDKYPFNG